MPWYDSFTDWYKKEFKPNVRETAEAWWNEEFKPNVESAIDNLFDSIIPDKAEEWVRDKIVVPATKEVIAKKIKDNAVLIGIGLALIGLTLTVFRRR